MINSLSHILVHSIDTDSRYIVDCVREPATHHAHLPKATMIVLRRVSAKRRTSKKKVRAHLAAAAFCLFLSLSAIVECEFLIRSRQCCNCTLGLPEPKALAARRLWTEWRRVRKDNEWERRNAGCNDGVDIVIIKKAVLLIQDG